jgi:hypothetical protein
MDRSTAVALLRAEGVSMKRKLTITGAVFLVAGIGLFVAGFSDTSYATWTMAGFSSLLGALLIYGARAQFKSGNFAMLTTLCDRPREVVWYYRTDYTVNGFRSPSRGVTVWYVNGKSSMLTVPTKRVESVFAAIRCLVPHAIEGFSDERAKQYKRDPRSLA